MNSTMGAWLILVYSLFAYAAMSAATFWEICFVGDFLVAKTVDQGPAAAWPLALLVNFALIALFGLQHSVMARQGFKNWWTRIIPPEAERSTHVLATSVVFVLLFWGWRPIPFTLWEITHPAGRAVLWGVFILGWVLVFLTSFLIDHFDAFGLKQPYLAFRRKPYHPPKLIFPFLYRWIRHPQMLGFILAYLSTPHMTVGHLQFGLGMTLYIVIGVAFEERDMIKQFGEDYRQYQLRAGKFLPRFWPRAAD